MRTVRSTFAAVLVGAVVLITACVATPEPQLEASPSVGVAVVGASPTQAPTEPDPNIDTRPDIYLVGPKSGAASLLLSAPGSQTNAEVSPHGSQVVYESRAPGDLPQIFVLKTDGTKRRLTRLKGGASDPTWSPDGTQIAFAARPFTGKGVNADADIFVMNADGSHIHRLAGTQERDTHPDWSPDGSAIAFQSGVNVGNGERSEIWVASVLDGTLNRLRLHDYNRGGDPAWSPDGRWIAFTQFAGGMLNGEIPYVELIVVRPDGTQQHRLGHEQYYRWKQNPSWSPDGRSLVFEDNHWRGSFGAGTDEILDRVRVIDVKSGQLRMVFKNVRHAQPTWGHDGILVSLSPVEASAMDKATVQIWDPEWEPSWTRPDASIVLTGARCEQDGDEGVLAPGVLTIEFVNESYREATFKVVRLTHGRPPDDLRIGGGWGERVGSSTTDIWSSPRQIASGRWAVVCFKDLIDSSHGFLMRRAGIVGPLEVG